MSAQIVDAGGQYVDTVFNDHIDRTAEDFVTVSLMIADAGSRFYTVLGHACLRLQCPTFDLDYCYSYESEDMTNRVLDFLMGKLQMGLFAIPTSEYCAYYAENGGASFRILFGAIASMIVVLFALAVSFATPSPAIYIKPRLNCAIAFPCSAAARYHFAASAAFSFRKSF